MRFTLELKNGIQKADTLMNSGLKSKKIMRVLMSKISKTVLIKLTMLPYLLMLRKNGFWLICAPGQDSGWMKEGHMMSFGHNFRQIMDSNSNLIISSTKV